MFSGKFFKLPFSTSMKTWKIGGTRKQKKNAHDACTLVKNLVMRIAIIFLLLLAFSGFGNCISIRRCAQASIFDRQISGRSLPLPPVDEEHRSHNVSARQRQPARSPERHLVRVRQRQARGELGGAREIRVFRDAASDAAARVVLQTAPAGHFPRLL